MMNKTRILILMAMLFTMQYGAEAQSEPEIIWHTPGVSADFLVLSPDGQYVYANRGDSKLGNVFSQLRVDDGTIVRKDVNTVGHIAGFTADGHHAIVVNLRISNIIYKVETETLEKVDSLEIRDTRTFYFLSFAMSYDNTYLYIGTEGHIPNIPGPEYPYNFFVIDIETMELIHKDSFIYPTGAGGINGEVLGIYPSPDNNYIALNVKSYIGGDVLGSRLLVLDVRDNYKNIATNPAIEYPFSGYIGSAAFTMDYSKLFVCVGGSAGSSGNKKTLIYETPEFRLIDSLLYSFHPNYGGGSSSVRPSLINPNFVFIGSILPTSSGYNISQLQKFSANNLKEICSIKSKAENYFQFIPTYILTDNETNIITFNKIVSIEGVGGMYKFKNCTPTSVKDDKNTIETLQVIDNKLTIPIEAIKGIMVNYQISDIRGVTIIQNSLLSNSNELVIDVHHLTHGTYFLTLKISEKMLNYKFMIVR
jgi:hypothetical protein